MLLVTGLRPYIFSAVIFVSATSIFGTAFTAFSRFLSANHTSKYINYPLFLTIKLMILLVGLTFNCTDRMISFSRVAIFLASVTITFIEHYNSLQRIKLRSGQIITDISWATKGSHVSWKKHSFSILVHIKNLSLLFQKNFALASVSIWFRIPLQKWSAQKNIVCTIFWTAYWVESLKITYF